MTAWINDCRTCRPGIPGCERIPSPDRILGNSEVGRFLKDSAGPLCLLNPDIY